MAKYQRISASSNGQLREQIINVGIISILLSVFGFFALFILPYFKWKWSNFLTLFVALLQLVMNWILPLALMSLINISTSLHLP
jgi:hypothetical protein